jgi:phosphate starvation-inducible PhoH-like protein
MCPFTAVDVMRHQLVQRIVLAYDRDDVRRRGGQPRRHELLGEVNGGDTGEAPAAEAEIEAPGGPNGHGH